jgi:uncharacterized protein involved in exopolysaccharide biosynthesis
MPFDRLMLVLRARLNLIVLVAAATVAAGAVVTMTQTRQYAATASLVINFTSESPFDERGFAPQLADSYLATQVDIIRSRNVVMRVVDALEPQADPLRREEMAVGILENLKIEVGRESRMIGIHYRSANPQRAADVANAFANAYVAATQQLAAGPARRNAEWFDSQIAGMRERLESAQARLTEFQQTKGIVALDEQVDTETSRLNELSDRLLQAQAMLADARARQLGINHPEYVRAAQQTETAAHSLEEQKQRVLSVKQQRAELDVLAGEVGIEKDAYGATLQNYYREQMRSSFGQTRAEVLDVATPPTKPSSPNVALNLAGSLLLGIALAGLFGVGAELAFRRLRSPDDLTELLDTRVLSSV